MSHDSNKSRDDKSCCMIRGFPPKPCVNFQELDDLPEEDKNTVETDVAGVPVDEECNEEDF